MSEANFGREISKMSWEPKKAISYGPAFAWPPQPVALFKWFFGFPGFLLPWTIPYALLACAIWYWMTPPLESFASFSLASALLVLLRNYILAFAVYGAWHLWFYTWKKQGTAFKYNRQWPKEASFFKFGHQVYDNMFYALASGVPIWTAYELLLMWAYANGYAPMIDWASNPVWFVAMFLVIPFIHEAGFYFAHRALHFDVLYKTAHHVHHRNTNPGPWSGLSMHPIEHVIYFASILLFFVIPAHPIHMINLASRLGVAPAQGHTGFDQIDLGDEKTMDVSYYAHYLHHKYFEVNYADGMIPLDKWFGSFHDGTPEAHEAMKERRARRSA
jgi:sterol desaturase/sphingolipid hydroxylase (fatty acid hydroxylase superfamily)